MKRSESSGYRVTCISPWCGCLRLRVPIHSDRAPGLPSTERPSPATPLDLRATPHPPKRGRRGLPGSSAASRIPCLPGFSRRGPSAEPRMTQVPSSHGLLNSVPLHPEPELPSPEPPTAMIGDPKMGTVPNFPLERVTRDPRRNWRLRPGFARHATRPAARASPASRAPSMSTGRRQARRHPIASPS